MKIKKAFLMVTSVAVIVTISVLSASAAGLPERISDMTYAYGENAIYWPNATPFKLTPEFRGMTERGYWYAANFYAASEHSGTHPDAPLTYSEDIHTSHYLLEKIKGGRICQANMPIISRNKVMQCITGKALTVFPSRIAFFNSR
ncbi:MAG: hypothetical protein ABFD66_15260 [Smithella sp.]